MSKEIKQEEFANGTVIVSFCNNILNIKAPNPFGGFWSKSYDTAIHNRAYSQDYITRRGKRWILSDRGDDGMAWVEWKV